MVECSTCSTTSVHRCLHSMIEKLCDTMCVVFSTMWLLCPKLVETSLSHFSRQSLQQVVLSSNFGRDVNNTNGATTEPTNHLPHKQKQNSQPNKNRNTLRKKNKRSTLEEMSTTPAEQPLSQPTIYHIIKNKTVNQTKIGTLNGKRTKDKLCKRCQQHQRINPSTDQATTS